jgi:oligopeptide/dipeptide ABC transporter ATP-binding protein
MAGEAILEARTLVKRYARRGSMWSALVGGARPDVTAVDGVSLELMRGEVLAVVGESGSGKSTLARLLCLLEEPTAGDVFFEGRSVSALRGAGLRALRRKLQMVFQNPYESLNPRMTVYEIVAEPLVCLGIGDPRDHRRQVSEVLERVELRPPERYLARYPARLSGGQRQRVAIARALIGRPEVVIADEPVSMLDVSIRAEVLRLLQRLKEEFDVTYLFITHDLAVARHFADRLMTMYRGQVVELGDTETVIRDPRHPYTRALLSAVPVPDPDYRRPGVRIRGGMIDRPALPPTGCVFEPRCPDAMERCKIEAPVYSVNEGGGVACHLAAP